MHAEIKRTAIYNDELKALGDFVSDMKTRYQTSLGLGPPFSRDSSIQGKRRGRKARGRSYSRTPRTKGWASPEAGAYHIRSRQVTTAGEAPRGCTRSERRPLEELGIGVILWFPSEGQVFVMTTWLGPVKGRSCKFFH